MFFKIADKMENVTRELEPIKNENSRTKKI